MAEAGKTTENRPLHRQNWVRIRRVTPPRKSAFKVQQPGFRVNELVLVTTMLDAEEYTK